MNLSKKFTFLLFCCIVFFSAFIIHQSRKPTLFLIGDSTVKNGQGKGGGGLWGWGDFIAPYFDPSKIAIENHALGGTSSRTFQTKGLWTKVLDKLQPGDFVIMQFGHNDGSPLDDTARARGTIKGTGEESKEIYNPITKEQEVVHTYGWYMRKFINEAKAKGATAIVCSPIPRNSFKDGKVGRANDNYGGWAEQVARETGAPFIDLNNIVATKYEDLGEEKVRAFFPGDHTHTNDAGAKLNAASVVEGLRQIKGSALGNYLLNK